MTPADAVRLGKSLEGLHDALARVAALQREPAPPKRQGSALPGG